MALLREAAQLRRCALHAYCLMTNHIHLLLTPPDEEACCLVMRDVGRDYASYINRRYARTGSLWERPFKSCLVDSAAYVLNCYRYIERNPVRAGMVVHPADHRWSSYAGNAAERSDVLLTEHAEYAALGDDAPARQRSYRRLLQDADQETFLREMREATHAGFPLVGDGLKAMLEKQGVRIDRGKPGPRLASEPMRDATPGQLELIE
jgi:putative transposase